MDLPGQHVEGHMGGLAEPAGPPDQVPGGLLICRHHAHAPIVTGLRGPHPVYPAGYGWL